MKIKDLLKFDHEAEIIITLEREGVYFNGSVCFNMEKCREIVLRDMTEKDSSLVEFYFVEKKNEQPKKRRGVGIPI